MSVVKAPCSVASSPLGPFRFKGVALPRRGPKHWDGMATHNPTIHWDAASGQYALFYIGITYSFEPPRAGTFSNRTQYEAAWNSKRVGVAVAKSVYGPWTRLDAPILDTRPASLPTHPHPRLSLPSSPPVTRSPGQPVSLSPSTCCPGAVGRGHHL